MEESIEKLDEEIEQEEGFIKLFEHASIGDIRAIKSALCVYEITNGKVYNLRIANKYGVYLIHTAAYYGQQAVIEFLLSSVNEVEEKDTIIYEAITSDNVSFESTDTDGLSTESRILPITLGHAKSSTCYVNIRSLDKAATPLHFAAMGGNRNNVILYLLSYGADPRLKDINGNTPQDTARAHGHKKTEKVIKKYVQAINKKMQEE
ncbi:hypothetical protein NEFER03_1982 [Nematocida sp. LUAm3]|nr:hypothetical protein NEFER03_1982 [Nematocida sp. LUAm3]KAI5176066.1 hypothetical protein NEFER02_1900 [Nematocida sp. LUAm2]KAI5177110.1 hypothetical protein NEFER01_0385 [Nematocida sp. LUAm1]